MLREILSPESGRYSGRVVRDELGMQLLLKRTQPDALLLSLDDEAQRELAASLRNDDKLAESKFIGITNPESENEAARLQLDALVERPLDAETVLETLDRLFAEIDEPSPEPSGSA